MNAECRVGYEPGRPQPGVRQTYDCFMTTRAVNFGQEILN